MDHTNPQNKVECPDCQKEVSKSNLARHRKLVHGFERERPHDTKIDLCPICASKLTEKSWKPHFKAKHSENGYMTFGQYMRAHPNDPYMVSQKPIRV